MKKLLLTLCILTVSLSGYSQLSTRAAMDYFPGGLRELISTVNSDGQTISQNQILASYGDFRVRIGADYRIGRFKAYFDQNVYMGLGESWTFRPNSAEWSVGLTFKIMDGVRLQFEHLCGHPVLNDLNVDGRGVQIRKGYNMISINYGY